MTRYTRYAWPSIGAHWLIALLIFGGFALGLYMHDLPLSPQKLRFYSYHKWLGVTVFVLVLARLFLRWRYPPPPLLPAPHWQQRAAQGVHHAFYLLMFAIPLSGWLMSSAKGFSTVWFGVLPLPDLLEKDEALGDLLRDLHAALNWLLAMLVCLHVGAAMKHHWRDRDATLARMLPWIRR
jgi:cytochrome b561